MPFRPDIVVMRLDYPEVLPVVHIQESVADQNSAEIGLKSYMVETNVPVGMLVSPEQARFYRNRYIDYTPQSVHLIGECPTVELLGVREGATEGPLERLVQDWLEDLQSSSGERSWPASVREAIEYSVLPVLNEGTVRAAGPLAPRGVARMRHVFVETNWVFAYAAPGTPAKTKRMQPRNNDISRTRAIAGGADHRCLWSAQLLTWRCSARDVP